MEENILVKKRKVILFGGSAGSIQALVQILPLIHEITSLSIIIVLHRKSTDDQTLEELIKIKSKIMLRKVEDKVRLLPGYIYVAPSNYHLLFEKDYTISLDYSEKVNYSRPSIDVSFESAAEAYHENTTAILLSGSNSDGTYGLLRVKQNKGITIVQDPEDAEMIYMPQHAIDNVVPKYILKNKEIANHIITLDKIGI